MKMNDVRSRLKRNNLVFHTYKWLIDHNYRSNLLDYLIKKNVKSRKVISNEMAILKKYWKCDPAYYYRYRLYEKSLTPDELLDYVPPYYFYNFYMPSIYNDANISIADSKMRMNKYFISKNIETPKLISTILNGVIHDSSGVKMGYSDLIENLRGSGSKVFFMKPDRGRGGKGILKIERISKEFFLNDEFLDEVMFESIISNRDFIIQESIEQRNDLRVLYPYSVNTLRVITQWRDQDCSICAVVLRMGRNGSYVDNSSCGGVFASVDMNTGEISKNAHLHDSNQKFDMHPDTGFRFEGFKIAGWDAIKQDITGIVRKAPEFPDIAWDIAVTEDKVMVIEFNRNYGLDQLQTCLGGMRRRLNINPYTSQGNNKYLLKL